jgi:cbb3-type cytochrome oxidase maturation protein
MSIIILLILASLFVALIFLVLFLWAVNTGQFKDTFTPSIRIFKDDNNKNII